MPMLKLEPSQVPNDLLCLKLPRSVRFKLHPQLIYRLDYAMCALFHVYTRTKHRLIVHPWRQQAVEQLLRFFTFEQCIHQVSLCRQGARKSLPKAVFAALYMDAVRIEHALFWALQDFMVNPTPFAVKFCAHDIVHAQFIGCECVVRGCRCEELWKQARTYRASTYENHFFARKLVHGRTLFDLCVECAADASDEEVALLRHYLQRRGCTITSLQDTRLALISMWMYEHARRPTFQHGMLPSLRVKKGCRTMKLYQGNDVPDKGVPAFGAFVVLV